MELDNPQNLVADGLVSVRQAAEFLGVSVSLLYGMMARGELVFVKIGRCRRIPKRALIELASRSIVARQNA
jgi:excisionase family DNA binding protein